MVATAATPRSTATVPRPAVAPRPSTPPSTAITPRPAVVSRLDAAAAPRLTNASSVPSTAAPRLAKADAETSRLPKDAGRLADPAAAAAADFQAGQALLGG